MSESLSENLAILGLRISDPYLRSKLKMLRSENHPDTSGGHFQSDKQRIAYHATDDSLRILDETIADERGTSLQTLSKNQIAIIETQALLLKLIDEQRQQVTAASAQDAVTSSESRARLKIASSVHQFYAPFSIGGWSVAGFAAAVSVLDKPLGGFIEELFSGNLAAAHNAKLILGVIAIVGLILGFVAKRQETRKTQRLTSIMTDAGIQHLLYRYDYYIFDHESENSEKIMSLSSLANGVAEFSQIKEREACEATAEAIIRKLEQRGLIRAIEKKGLSPRFEMDKELADSISYDPYSHFDEHAEFRQRTRLQLKKTFQSFAKMFSKRI